MTVVQKDGRRIPLDPAKTYTLASHNYLIKYGGDGLNQFMDNPLLPDEEMLDYQVLLTYIRRNWTAPSTVHTVCRRDGYKLTK